ncbi:MAG: hypothetical protein NVS9B1_24700 [Candidatus Dormibacteraceae bacterium]
MTDCALPAVRAAIGAIALTTAVLNFKQAVLIRPHREWAFGALICQSVGGSLMLLGLAGPIGPGMVAEVTLVVAVVSSAPGGFWDISGRLGYFPALRAMSGLRSGRILFSAGVVAAAIAVIGNGAPSLDRALGLAVPGPAKAVWFAYLVVSALLVVLVRMFYGRN